MTWLYMYNILPKSSNNPRISKWAQQNKQLITFLYTSETYMETNIYGSIPSINVSTNMKQLGLHLKTAYIMCQSHKRLMQEIQVFS